jgi:hypothetical protein
MRFGAKFLLVVVALAASAAIPAYGQGRSPFLPPDVEAAPTVTEDAPLQFCGIVGEGESARYCVYDASRRRSYWLRAGEQSGNVQVQTFDSDNRTVSVVQNGRPMVLKLQTAKLGPAAPGAMPGPLPVAGGPQPGNPLVNTVVTNPTPADEAKRLEAVAAEVRRRRALRQAAAQAQGQPQIEQPQGNPR